MNKVRYLLATAALMLIAGGCATLTNPDGRPAVKDLRCEYRVDPLGIGAATPRLSWIMQSSRQGQIQTAYHILVAGSKDLLKRNVGDFWDSGKVRSDQSSQIVYQGVPLSSRQQCCWKVRVWDKDGNASPWSATATWTVGLLDPGDWRAKWIGYDADPSDAYPATKEQDPLSLDGCSWVWYPGEDGAKPVPVGTRYFRHSLKITSGRKIKQARFRLLADNEGTLYVNGQLVQKFSGWQPTYTLDVTDKLKPAENALAIAVENKGDAPNPAGLCGQAACRVCRRCKPDALG